MELEKQQTLIPPYMRVSEAGVHGIHNYIRLEMGRKTYLSLPLSWSWEWLVTQGQYRGKLPNRLAGMLKTRHDIKLTAKQKSIIGNIARKHLLAKDAYTIDFTDTFDWDAGDFGDHGSCFWTENRGARKVMEEEGVVAIRFYDEDGKGTGRAWLYELSSDTWVLFNAYGLDCSEAASVFAAKLREDTGDAWEYEELDYLRINGTSRGVVYINGCPQIIYRGYSHGGSVDLDWDVPYSTCTRCGEWAHEDELFYDEEDCECYCYDCYEILIGKRKEKRLAELEEQLEEEMEEDFRSNASRAETVHIFAQEAIRASIAAQVAAGQLNLGVEYQVNLFYG